MDITILIPTLNRPDFLLRELRYYQSVNFRGKIFIGDSSETTTARRISNSLQQFASALEISYHGLPGCNVSQAIKIMADKVTTKYVAFIADDDFLVPTGIEQCLDFLDSHHDYVAAHGVGIVMGLSSHDEKTVEYINYYQQPIVEETTAAQRLSAHLSNYTVSLFSAHRIKVWRTMFKDAEDIADKSFEAELLPCCLSAILGKIKQLDGLYVIRQVHENRYWLPTWFKWITSETWYPSYTAFYNHLAEAIAHQDEITIEEAGSIVSRAFAVYLAQCIPRNPPKGHSIARSIWYVLQSLRNKFINDNKYCLSNMLRPESPYYNDFTPIYKIVTQR